jgi:capsule polysaccharide export protein KpsC/LpsZ
VPPLRRRRRSLEEMFYLFYCEFTCYVDPYAKRLGDLRGTIDHLSRMVEETRK